MSRSCLAHTSPYHELQVALMAQSLYSFTAHIMHRDEVMQRWLDTASRCSLQRSKTPHMRLDMIRLPPSTLYDKAPYDTL